MRYYVIANPSTVVRKMLIDTLTKEYGFKDFGSRLPHMSIDVGSKEILGCSGLADRIDDGYHTVVSIDKLFSLLDSGVIHDEDKTIRINDDGSITCENIVISKQAVQEVIKKWTKSHK